jgi:hypothetical protein
MIRSHTSVGISFYVRGVRWLERVIKWTGLPASQKVQKLQQAVNSTEIYLKLKMGGMRPASIRISM